MKCSGRYALSGEDITLEFASTITNVDPILTGDVLHYDPEVWLAPGFIDLQVNGFAGVDFNSPSVPIDELARATGAILSTGVTRFYPTVITGSPEDMQAALRNLAKTKESNEIFDAMEAFHVEGPHISPEDGPRGAHPKQWVRPPDINEFWRWQEAASGQVRIVTIAPEWPGACGYIEAITRESVVASIGHTRATAAQIQDAVSAGATMSTHLGNGAGSKTRTEEFITAQLMEPRLAASFIVDEHHLPVEFLQRALREKGTERSVLITDAVAPAMCAPGLYMLGGVKVELRSDDSDLSESSTSDARSGHTNDARSGHTNDARSGHTKVTLAGGERLAGSALRMDHAISNVMARAGVTLAEAITMATTNAARAGRVRSRLRGFRPGERADIVQFRMNAGRVEVEEVWVGGKKA